ncbi:hypothetical protein [Nostoc sp.]|uniref:hypothetical protein n=1 Tax=Nostoc sp. TaxID=1180 RepID=UPI002FF6920B
MTFWIREWGWGVGSRESGVGSGGDEGDEGDKEKITNAQCPMPNAQYPILLILRFYIFSYNFVK